MEDNLGTSQAPNQNQDIGSNVSRLENELDDLKRQARASGGSNDGIENPFLEGSSSRSSKDGGLLVKIGSLIFIISVIIAGFYIAKSIFKTINNRKTESPSAVVTPPPPNVTQGVSEDFASPSSLPNTGIFSNDEPTTSTGSSSFGEISE